MKQVHNRQSPLMSPDESFRVTLITASLKSTKCYYSNVQEALVNLETYEPIYLNDYTPQDRYQRRHWVDSLHLQFPVILYKFSHHASIGTRVLCGEQEKMLIAQENSIVK